MIICGIDVGSRTTKIVLFNRAQHLVVSQIIADTAMHKKSSVKKLFLSLLRSALLKPSHIQKIAATGYGRDSVSFADETITEITCHARGVQYYLPKTKTVIEIGGQDSKIIRLDDKGTIIDFMLNNRCAAGTGRFMETVTKLLHIDLKKMNSLIKKSKKPAVINSTCVVFAESEIISLLSKHIKREDILSGVQKSLAQRVINLLGKKCLEPIVFTGGVALIPGMAYSLSKILKNPISVCPFPQYTGALGAALKISEQWTVSVCSG